VAACPTGALRFRRQDSDESRPGAALVPGFADPAGCGPSIRFTPPAGTRRAVLFQSIEEALTR
jgi:hypothetical protein